MAYTLHATCVMRADGASIPFDPQNSDYAAFLAWVEAGNVPDTASQAILVVPTTVTMRQARLALLGAGKLPAIRAAIDSLEGLDGEAARIEWEFAANVERDSPIVAMLAAAVELDYTALDALFTSAATL